MWFLLYVLVNIKYHMTNFKFAALFAVALSLSVSAQTTDAALPVAEDAVVQADQSPWQFDGGFDLRLRQELWDHIPAPGGGGAKQENFFRFRTRVWGEAKYGDDFRFYTRVANEWRKYIARRDVVSNYTWPDELVLDNFFVDINNCFGDFIDFRIGRQDLNYFGSWRIFGDGTPGDGSRTFYSDAAVMTMHLDDENDLRLFGLYNMPYNYFTIGHPTGVPKSWGDERQQTQVEASARDMSDAGAGVYYTTRSIDPKMPLDIYSIWRRQSDYKIGDTKYQGRNIWTQGILFKPSFTEEWSAEFEAAWQGGRVDDGRDICAWMAYAATTWRPTVQEGWKPYLTLAFYALSGDKNPTKGTDTNWNPMWARHPMLSELLLVRNTGYYGVGYWSNMMYPHLAAGTKIFDRHSILSHTGPLFAETADEDYTRSGGHGQYQGWLGVLEYMVVMVKGAIDGRGQVTGLVRAEAFAPGEYTSPRDEMAYFLRFQVMIAY